MSRIHLSTDGQKQSVHEESEVRERWLYGGFPPTTLYWKDGMPDWRPLSEFFAADSDPAAVPPPLVADPEPSAFAYTKDPTVLTAFLTMMLWFMLAAKVMALFCDLLQLRFAQSGSTDPVETQANDLRQGTLAMFTLVTFVVTGVSFLKWIYRANLNARGFGAEGMKFSPGWSIGYYFIPILNLFRPYQAMKEIWQASHEPRDWRVQEGSPLLSWWWTLWIVSGISGQICLRLSLAVSSPSTLADATMASIVSSVIDMALCFVAMALVKAIAGRQAALVAGER